MKLPTSGGHNTLQSVVSAKLETFTVTRTTHGAGAMGGTDSSSTHDVDMFVGSPNEVSQDTEYGERLTGSLVGLCLPTQDVQEGDRITYQSNDYEASEVIITDDDSGDTLLVVNFVRVTNDG